MKLWLYLLCIAVFLHGSLPHDSKICKRKECPTNNAKFQLDECSWDLMLEGEWMVGFCVPLISACLKFERAWTRFALDMQRLDSNVVVASMQLEYSETLVRRFSLNKLPTILHVKNGVFRKLPVVYSAHELQKLALVDWRNTEPVRFWQNPNGYYIKIYILYIRAIEVVYHINLFDMGNDYERATWLVRGAIVLTMMMTTTMLCNMYAYIRDRIDKAKKRARVRPAVAPGEGIAEQP